MKEHAKSLRRKRIGRSRFPSLTGGGGGSDPIVRSQGPRIGSVPSGRIAARSERAVPPMAADATRLETRTTEPFVSGETTAPETPESKGSRRPALAAAKTLSGVRSGIAIPRRGCEASRTHRTR